MCNMIRLVKRFKVCVQLWLTCGDTTTEQGEVLDAETVICAHKLHHTGRIHHRVLRESRSVQEMENGFPMNCGESACAISFHHLLHGIHPIYLTLVGLLTLAQGTLSTLPIEYWHHYVPFLHFTHSFPHTLHNPTNPSNLNWKQTPIHVNQLQSCCAYKLASTTPLESAYI